MNGAPPGRQGYADQSVIGYIPDDVSSVQSSMGGVGVSGGSSNYPQMFGGFAETWPTLPQQGRGANGRGMRNGASSQSVAGESVAASELTEANASTVDGRGIGQGGVSLGAGLAGLSINDVQKTQSLSQSDRLKRFMEANDRPANGFRSGAGDDDSRSVSTSFASQIDVGGYD